MGKPTGFIDYQRAAAPDRAPLERITNFEFIHTSLSAQQRTQQAARCMDCGVPFCQTNTVIDDRKMGCPLNNLIPEWNQQLWANNLPLALERLLKTNCFPEFTGYVCPALCERACSCQRASETKQAVSINDNERFIIDSAFEQGLMKPRIPAHRSGKRIAVVGSGPAGLTVAALLNQRGHSVTVYERNARPGGLLVYGIPNMKLPKTVVARRVELLQAEGISFECGVDVGKDISLETLAEQYSAVVLALGAQKAREVAFEGSATGVCYALDYLGAAARAYLRESACDPVLNAQGKTVAVVGAGDTANDCIATALRQGATDIVQLIRRPAADYGQATDYAHEETQAKFGRDIRCFETQVHAVHASEEGQLQSITLTTPEGLANIDAQLLIIASGFSGAETYATSGLDQEQFPQVFQAGDMATGASLVASTMAHARGVAHEVDEALTGYSVI